MPQLVLIDFREAHRLIPTRVSDRKTVLEGLGLPENVISDLTELDAATNERKLAEHSLMQGIGLNELLAGVPESQIVNAAFCHPGPHGSRFNSRDRGAWYAARELRTSMVEVAFHKRRFLQDAHLAEAYEYEYQDYLADFAGKFHQMDSSEVDIYMEPHPIPACYAAGQRLASELIFSQSNGLIYPSARYAGGTCIACFRPALVNNPRRGKRFKLRVSATEDLDFERDVEEMAS